MMLDCGPRILAKLQHPFIVNMFGSFHDPRYIYMVLEYIVGGEFFTHLRKVPLRHRDAMTWVVTKCN